MMNVIYKVCLTILTIIISTGLNASAVESADSQIRALVENNNAFAFDLYAQLKTEEGNLFFAPYSLATGLAMTYAGARGNTEKQMVRALHFSTNQNQFHSLFGQLLRQLKNANPQEESPWQAANTLWTQKGHLLFRHSFTMPPITRPV